MATRRTTMPVSQRELTLTERARRSQLVDVTIELVARRGFAGASLAAIANGAGISKAAVLYHFPSKDALVWAAYEHVLDALTEEVAKAIESAEVTDGPAAYVRSMIGHFRARPEHIRMIVEVMSHGDAEPDPESRWRPLAQLIEAAQRSPDAEPGGARTTAIIIGGAIDAIVSEQLRDPRYDTQTAAEHLVTMIESTLTGDRPRHGPSARGAVPPLRE